MQIKIKAVGEKWHMFTLGMSVSYLNGYFFC